MAQMTLMYITNSVSQATNALAAGADRIFVDLEKLGKQERQGGMDTVQSDHTLADVAAIREELPNAELLVRINPLGAHSKQEIDAAVSVGVNFLMLPMFRTTEEVRAFIDLVQGRAKVNLLLETPQAMVRLPDYLRFASEIDEIHVGLNDLHLGMELDFMFELLAGGMLDHMATQLNRHDVRFGFGGIARVGFGDIPAEDILLEHIRLGSQAVILSRSFHQNIDAGAAYQASFADEIAKLRAYETEWRSLTKDQLDQRSAALRQRIFAFTEARRAKG